MNYTITRDFSGADLMFVAELDGATLGTFPTWDAADQAISAAIIGARRPALMDVAGPDVPLDGPSVEEEGGEGGEPPPDDYISALAAHVAREYTAFLAAAPIAPASSPLQPAPAGGDAANAVGLEACRVCGEMHAPPSEVCDVNGCGRGPVGVYWFGIPGRCYPARLCSAHGTVVA